MIGRKRKATADGPRQPKVRRVNDGVIPLHACSKEEIEVCAILSLGLNGPNYDAFCAGHASKLPNALPKPDFVHGKHIYQYDGHAFHNGEAAVARDQRVNERHIQAGYTVVRLRDRLPPLPTCNGLTCVAVDAKDRCRTAVYTLVGLDRTPDNVRLVAEWLARRLHELVTVPEARRPGLQWLTQFCKSGLLLKHWCIPFENPDVRQKLQQLERDVGARCFAMLVDLYDLPEQIDIIRLWLHTLGPDRFVTLAGNGGVAARLADNGFDAALQSFVSLSNCDTMVRVFCIGSFTARFWPRSNPTKNDGFRKAVLDWLRMSQDPDQLATRTKQCVQTDGAKGLDSLAFLT